MSAGQIRIDGDDPGAAIRALRDMLRMSQADFAAETESYSSQVSMWETGQRRPDLATMAKIARNLGYDLALIPAEDA